MATINKGVQPVKATPVNAGAQNKADQNANQNADQGAMFAVIDDIELPASARGGARGSKYMDDRTEKTLLNLKAKQGFVIPFMKLDVKNPAGRQRYATKYRIDELIAAMQLEEGETAPKYTVAIVESGIAVRRDA